MLETISYRLVLPQWVFPQYNLMLAPTLSTTRTVHQLALLLSPRGHGRNGAAGGCAAQVGRQQAPRHHSGPALQAPAAVREHGCRQDCRQHAKERLSLTREVDAQVPIGGRAPAGPRVLLPRLHLAPAQQVAMPQEARRDG